MSDSVKAIRAQIFSRKHVAPLHLVSSTHLPDVTVGIRTLTLEERSEALNQSKDEDGDLDGMLMIPALVIACAVDPVSGERLFTAGDRDALAELPAVVIDDWAKPALELNGLGENAVRHAEKNSDRTPSSATSSSSSPAASADGQ